MASNYRNHSEGVESYYRAYAIGEDGKVRDWTDIFAQSDEHAIAQLREIAGGRPMELWDRSRLIVKLGSPDDTQT